MKVIKRNGKVVDFDRTRITDAIEKAMSETTQGVDKLLSNSIADTIEIHVSEGEETTVDEISDMVELLLANRDRFDASKRYILYRSERDKVRGTKEKEYKFLSNKFLSKYKHKPNPFPTELGEFVFYRTYSRYIPEEKRREYWWETVARAVDYNCSLGNTSREEAEELFDNIYNLRQFLSGRTTYVGGTAVTESSGLANFNCAGVVIDEFEKLGELFLLLMVGTGVGFRDLPVDIEKLPKIRTNVDLYHQQYQQAHRSERLEHTEVMFKGDIAKIIVGDSRFGWMKALDRFFEILTQKHYEHVSTIVINYNSIRPKGERLKTFGGFASGHEPLMNMFTKVMKTIKQHDAVWTKLRTIDVMDIANIIGENVVSGGVRRTSEVTLFDIDDKDVYTAKSGMYEQIDGEWKENKEILHRRMSNNSIFFQKPPTKEQIAKAITEARYSGEPGMIFGYNGRKRRENFDVVNPCVEILLADRGNCNLTTVNVMAFVKDGKFDFEMFARAQYLSGRASYRMTNVELELHKWNLVHKRDRLTGTSLTGIQDMFNATGMDHEQQIRFFKIAREAAINGANSVADEQGTPRSLLTTTIKPEGCWTGEYTRTLDQGIVFLDEIDKDIFDRPQGFSDLKENLTFEGNEVTKTYVNDVKDILKIKLKSGRELKITPSHPLMVNGEWVQAKDLKIGDKIDSKEVAYEGKVNSFLDDRLDLTNFRADVRDYAVPFEMNEDLAYLLGAYFANGSFTTNDRIKYHAQYLEQHLKIQKIWKKLFGVETKIVKSTDRDSYTQDFRSTKIRLWLDKNGLADKESNRIPLAIRTSSREAILSFFVGYADNDGHFAAKSFSIDTAKEEWARHLQEVGEAVGLVFGLSINKARDNSFSGKPMYKLYLQRSFSAKDIFEYVNNHSIKAAMQGLIQSGAVRSKHPHTIVGIEELEQQATYDIEVENVHMYAQGALISHNTMTQLPTVSSGIHFNHSEYYIRRVRINSGDPLVKAIKEIGWEIKPEVGQEIETADTVVVEFPVKSPAGKTKFDVGAIEQLELYKMSMEHYTQHNTSITVHVRDHEWDDVIDWIDENKDWMIAVSFLSLDDSYYQLMPYEAIDEETYNKMEAQMKPFKPSLLSKYETGQDFDLGDAECATGSCPIR